MQYETAGDPMTGLKWTRKTTEKIARALACVGIKVCANTVARLLRQLGFSLRVNAKTIESGLCRRSDPAGRDRQFRYISQLREHFAAHGHAIISVDTKKRELIGNFKQVGRVWSQEALAVNDHDFRSDALGVAIPYGIYEPLSNRGSVFIGTTHDTPAFAVDCVRRWWQTDGRRAYANPGHVLILADCGGSNGYRARAWKFRLHRQLCEQHGVRVTVCHYPPGASKWNPVEHRLFAEISKHWAGKPLNTYETALRYIRRTKTKTGLKAKARLITKPYEKGERITDKQMRTLPLQRHDILPDWNYTLCPSKTQSYS